MNKAAIFSWVIVLAVIGGALYVMNMLFGLVGVGLTAAFTLPIVALMVYFGDMGGGSSGGHSNASKGARTEE